MSKRKIPDTGGLDVWFEVGTFSLDGVRSFRFLKKRKKNILWINKFRTFMFVFDSHIGIILILYVCRTMQIAKIFVEMFQKLCNDIISIKNLLLTNLDSNKHTKKSFKSRLNFRKLYT